MTHTIHTYLFLQESHIKSLVSGQEKVILYLYIYIERYNRIMHGSINTITKASKTLILLTFMPQILHNPRAIFN